VEGVDEESREFADGLVRVTFFLEGLVTEVFAMHLFLKKRGLYEEYVQDEELARKVYKVLGEPRGR